MLIMAVLGVVKLVSSMGSQLILREPDPIIPITNRIVYIVIGCAELGLAFILSRRVNGILKLKLIASMAAVFCVYHVILLAYHWHGSCPCLGNATEWLHLDPPVAGRIVAFMNLYLFCGSVGILAYARFCLDVQNLSTWRWFEEGI